MPYTSTTSPWEASTSSGAMSAKLRSLGQKGRPQIKISLKGFEESWVASYSTLDKIEGVVSMRCPSDTRFDNLEINFIGTSKAFIERLSSGTANSGKTEAYHQFLRLSQPNLSTLWPADKVLKAGKSYDFAFDFIVPQQLLSRACHHNVSSDNVHQEHLQLPPSLGDKAVAGHGPQLLDDFAPDMARVTYAITASIHGPTMTGRSQEPHIKAKNIRIVPAVEEKAPLSVDDPESEYTLRREKDLRKGVFKGKLGRIVVEAAQPKSMSISPYKSHEEPIESTVVTLNLRFDPADSKVKPPALSTLSTKLKVATYFATSARAKLPTRKDIQWDMYQGVQSQTVNLASRCVAQVQWTHYEDSNAAMRRSSNCTSDSGSSSYHSQGVEPSAKYHGQGYYTAQVLVPITLPTNKAWVPTFHSCLISRVYSLNLSLSTQSSVAAIDLKIPVQLSSQGNTETMARHRASVVELEQLAYEAMEADEYFAQGSISRSSPDYATGASFIIGALAEDDLPPGYDELARLSNRRPILV